jgi:hypothetical protein
MRREAVEKVGDFDESSASGQDWDLLLRFSRTCRFGYIDRALTVLRVLEDATHRVYLEKDKLFMLGVLRREARDFNRDPAVLAAARRGMAGLTKELAWFYMAAGRKSDAIDALVHGFRESHDAGLLLRAMALVLPVHVSEKMKRPSAKSKPHASVQPPFKP